MKKAISLLLMLSLCLSLVACGDAPTNEPSSETLSSAESPSQSTEATVPSNDPTQPSEPQVDRYHEGEYIVGVDISAGEYVLFAKGEYNFRLFSNSQHQDTVHEGCSSLTRTSTYLILRDGQCLVINSGYIVPIEKSKLELSEKGRIFKVGHDVDAGEYTSVCDNSFSAGSENDIFYLWYVYVFTMNEDGVLIQKSVKGTHAANKSYYESIYENGVCVQNIESEEFDYSVILEDGDYVLTSGCYLTAN